MRRRGRHTLKHAGPDRVTVDELQQRFEEAEDTAAGYWDRVGQVLEEEDAHVWIAEWPASLIFDPPVDRTPGVSVSELQRFRDRLADIEPLIHELTEKP